MDHGPTIIACLMLIRLDTNQISLILLFARLIQLYIYTNQCWKRKTKHSHPKQNCKSEYRQFNLCNLKENPNQYKPIHMDKSSVKVVLFVALLLFYAGNQLGVEARNVPFPCQTVADCSPPGLCECRMNLCFCHPPKAFETLIGNGHT
ncbi:hypothetical protein Tsubulata_014493 [Turnera subulata]|uniref:Uncharacterized protein n=1 Tax=Turnera subulata TaxID=218843 RepID=A0A9Q0JRV5_9ROSI|nr:hypothetical protein Tsubulata_014493 [Turnera subulata]